MEESKQRARRKKLTGAVLSAVVIGVLLIGMALLYLWMFTTLQGLPLALMVLYIVAPAACVVGIILALRQRIKEIKGGEEDAVDQY